MDHKKSLINYEISDEGCDKLVKAVMMHTIKQLRKIETNDSPIARLERYNRYRSQKEALEEKVRTNTYPHSGGKARDRIKILSRKMEEEKDGKGKLKKIAFLGFIQRWANKENLWCRAFSDVRNVDIDVIVNKLREEAQKKIDLIISSSQ